LVHFLGLEWCRNTFLDPSNKADFSFKPTQSMDPIDNARFRHYVTNLAEMLLNFQSIQGFDERLAGLKNKTDVQAAVAELEAAELLFKSRIPFRFVPERSRKGFDYDMEAVLGGNSVPCEAKCKMPSTLVSDKTIKRSLAQSNTQVPRDKANIAFIRIPEIWIKDPYSRAAYERALKRAFGRIHRISAVVAYYETWETAGDGCICLLRSCTDHNKNARHPLTEFGNIILPTSRVQYPFAGALATQIINDVWRSIPDIIGRPRLVTLTLTREDGHTESFVVK
jgi:hypothetical protein